MLKRSTPLKSKSTLKRSGPIKPKSPKGNRKASVKRGSAAASEWMGTVASLGCCICRRLGFGPTPAMVHHIRTGKGMGVRADDDETIPLCHEHHQGETGIHGMGRKAFEAHYGVTELELLDETRALVQART